MVLSNIFLEIRPAPLLFHRAASLPTHRHTTCYAMLCYASLVERGPERMRCYSYNEIVLDEMKDVEELMVVQVGLRSNDR